MVNDLKDKKNVFEWVTPLSCVIESNGNGKKDMIVRAVAISESVSRNNVTYIAKELEMAAPTWQGKPLLLDHVNSVKNIVGRIVKSWYDEGSKAVLFEGRVVDEEIKQMIRDKRLVDVSIGARVESLEDDGNGTVIAHGIEGLEISFVAVPGVVNQGIYSFQESIERGYMNEKMKKEKAAKEFVTKIWKEAEEKIKKEKKTNEICNDNSNKLVLRFIK